jgi:hypothetical protein
MLSPGTVPKMPGSYGAKFFTLLGLAPGGVPLREKMCLCVVRLCVSDTVCVCDCV